MERVGQTLFAASGLGKDYGPVRVLDGIDLDIREGEILGLLGANGAGKSTLCRIISGLVSSSRGSMRLGASAYAPANKQLAESLGVQIVQQELNLIPTLSVAENLTLNRMPHRLGVIRRAALRHLAVQALQRVGLEDVSPDRIAGELGIGTQQMIEIAAALDRKCRLLILDEPTAALSVREANRLFHWLGELKKQGVGIIYVSHRLEEVQQLTDRVTVLRDGKHVATVPTETLSTRQMVELMTGTEHDESRCENYRCQIQSQVALRVTKLSREPLVRDVSFEVQRGERFGIAGLVGSGRTELLRAIFGADCPRRGDVEVVGHAPPQRFTSPAKSVRAKMAMVTEDRKSTGLLLSQPIRVNTTLGSLWKVTRGAGLLSRRKEIQRAEYQRAEMETRCHSIEQRVDTLSGGNQQKVAISKWLEVDADVFLFDEPTRGIDVAARERIYRLFDTLAEAGKSLVIVSSDLDELLDNCDRIGVMSAGQMVQIFERDSWSRHAIMQAAFAEQVTTEVRS